MFNFFQDNNSWCNVGFLCFSMFHGWVYVMWILNWTLFLSFTSWVFLAKYKCPLEHPVKEHYFIIKTVVSHNDSVLLILNLLPILIFSDVTSWIIQKWRHQKNSFEFWCFVISGNSSWLTCTLSPWPKFIKISWRRFYTRILEYSRIQCS